MAKHHIPRQTDRNIADRLVSLFKASSETGSVQFKAHGQKFTVNFPEQSEPPWQELLAVNAASVESFNTTLAGVSISYTRGGHAEQKSPHFDGLDTSIDKPDAELMGAASRVLAEFGPTILPLPTASHEESVLALRAVQEATLARLEQIHEKAIVETVAFRKELEERYAERSQELDRRFTAEKDRLDQETAQQRDRLAKREEELDNKDNTHARRERLERMLRDVKGRIEAFGVSKSTEAKRQPVRWGILILATLLLFGLLATTVELRQLDRLAQGAAMATATPAAPAASEAASAIAAFKAIGGDSPAPRWWLWIRIAVLSFGLAATVVYYVRWEGRWADHHAQSEFALQQFYIDVNRANWLVESCLEWRKETASDVPDELLKAIGRGLFLSTDGPQDISMNPADELASALLGSASKLKLKTGNSELEFDKPGKIPKSG